MRSRAAAAVLSRAGFKEVYSMEGGIKAWKGLVARGAPEAGMAYFSPANRTEELMALAWLLEDGSSKFYSEMAEMLEEREVVNLFKGLSADEEAHKSSIFKIYQEFSGQRSAPGFPGSVITVKPGAEYMEGGVDVREALEWAKAEKPGEILEFSISLEVNSHDLYIKMERTVEDKEAKGVFNKLSEEEKKHLARLSSIFEKGLRKEGG